MSASTAGGASVGPRSRGIQVVVFRVGAQRFAAPRAQVRAIRESPRVRSKLQAGSVAAASVPLVSLSLVLGQDRDTSVDRRVLEVEHWGQRIGLEVTLIEGIRSLDGAVLHPLPPVIARNLSTAQLLGVLEWLQSAEDAGRNAALEQGQEDTKESPPPALALDLSALLVEQGVDVPEPEVTE